MDSEMEKKIGLTVIKGQFVACLASVRLCIVGVSVFIYVFISRKYYIRVYRGVRRPFY